MDKNDENSSTMSHAQVDTVARDEELVKNLQKTMVDAVRASNALPRLGETYELHATFSLFANFMETQRTRIISLMRNLLLHSGCRARIPRILHDMETLIDSNDTLAERASISFDEFVAALNAERLMIQQRELGAEPVPGGVAVMLRNEQRIAKPTESYGHDKSGRYTILSTLPEAQKHELPTQSLSRPIKHHGLLVQMNIQKPQLSFQQNINNSDAPFVPKLRVKYHEAQHPGSRIRIIDESATLISSDQSSRKAWLNDTDVSEHPYQFELDHFKVPESQLQKREILPIKELEDVPVNFVKTVDDLKQLIQILNESKEFAVDLEHHEYRSFLGITCLIQISTRDADYIIDPFPLWNDLHILNEPFTNPTILKVFHGGESDIEWLQRDFGIYVVDMFDTFEALNMLGMHPKSLKYLVQQFCGVELNKEFQRADWRLRPLTEDHIVYARSDTRYLLSCYDGIQNRLLDEGNEYKNLLMTTYEKSVRICLRTFQQPRFDPNGYLSLLKGRRAINNRQSYALKELWKWRDATAREEDESLDYVLPSHMMLQIAEILPKEQNGIFACCAPIPLMVKRDVKFLHSIIRIALDLPLEKTNTSVSVEELMNATRVAQIADNENKITKLKAKLRPRIDFSTFRVDEQVPPLNSRLKINQRPIKEKPGFELPIVMDVKKQQGEAFIRIDDETEEKNELDKRIKKILKKINEWATPFDCYLVAMKEAEKEENGPKKDDEAKADTEAVLFSHHDEANVRIMNTTNGPVTSASQSTTVHAQATLLEDELNQSFPGLKLTKKQKQRLHKQTDINVRSNQSQNRRGLKRGHEHFSPSTSHETSTDMTNSSPMNLTGNPVVDYSSYDPQMFYQKPDTSKVYNPFKPQGGNRQKFGKKQRGGKESGGGSGRRSTTSQSNKPKTERS